MPDKIIKPEINNTKRFLQLLKKEIEIRNIKFDNPGQILILGKKLMMWFSKPNSESLQDYENRSVQKLLALHKRLSRTSQLSQEKNLRKK